MAKTSNSENFPVVSLLLSKKTRAQVMDFYRFARWADDVADSPNLSDDEKLSQLNIETYCPFRNDLLKAFRRDVRQNRYENWNDLMDYCRYSANPVGRFLLDLQGEDPVCIPASDALCSALQVLNHLQDCALDYKELNRIYLPGENLESHLEKDHTDPALRKILDRCLAATQDLIEQARTLPAQVKDKRLKYQAKCTILCAEALWKKLKTQDPLARRVELTTGDKLMIAVQGVFA